MSLVCEILDRDVMTAKHPKRLVAERLIKAGAPLVLKTITGDESKDISGDDVEFQQEIFRTRDTQNNSTVYYWNPTTYKQSHKDVR